MGQMEENGRYNMIHKFHPDKNRWDGVEPHIYKENPGVFREVTKQILFDNETTCRCSSVISRWRRTASLRLSIISTCMLS